VTTLLMIVDDMIAPAPGGIARYTRELTREIIAAAPRGCVVDAFVASSPEPDYDEVHRLLPGLGTLHKSALARRELIAAWQHGFTRLPGSEMVHAPSLLAPLRRHDRVNDGNQVAVTLHHLFAWTHPDSLSPRLVSWHKGMVKRAERYADAIVVPSHAVAERLGEFADFGDRVRVIGGAPSTSLARPADEDERAARLELPERYLLAIGGGLEPRRGIDRLLQAMRGIDIPLIVVGPEPDDSRLRELADGLPDGRVRGIGQVSDSDLAVLIDRAAVYVHPALDEGFGLPVLEAFALGTPVVHSDAPALLEVAADASVIVELAPDDGYSDRLADAVRSVLDDPQRAARLAVAGVDRSRAFSWRNSAEKVWQLHADL
jgi:glycosyltransferase involved in cell wall biosynthesis